MSGFALRKQADVCVRRGGGGGLRGEGIYPFLQVLLSMLLILMLMRW